MIRLGRVEITGGCLLLLAWLNYLDRELLLPMALVSCGAHELGHVAAIRLLGGNIKQLRLTAVGAELVLDRTLGYWPEGVSALAGPGVNLLLALLCCQFSWGLSFAGLNLVLALFNLLPIGRLDGGRALYCTLALLAGPGLAAGARGWLDLLCTAAALAAGLALAAVWGNVTLLLAGLWMLAVLLWDKFGRRRGKFRIFWK